MDAVGETAAQTIAAFDSAVFRQVIGNFMSGVVVITTRHDGVDHGMTVSAISSLSLEPPLLLICLNVNSGTQEAVRRAGTFGVNILAEHQGDLADRFARSGVPTSSSGSACVRGAPVFPCSPTPWRSWSAGWSRSSPPARTESSCPR